MNKKVVSAIILFGISPLIIIGIAFASYMHTSSFPWWLGFAFIVFLMFGKSFLYKVMERHPNEYGEANRIMFTKKTNYGWYALVFLIVFFALFYAYLFSKGGYYN